MIKEIYQFAAIKQLIIGSCKPDFLYSYHNTDRPFAPHNNSKEDISFTKSIIVAGLSLSKKIEGIHNDGVPRGRLSFVALGTDYHRLLTAQLQELANILQRHQSFQYKIHVDTGPLPEKDLAVSAGLGFKGRNSLVISPQFGSFFAIGLLLINLELPESPATALKGCGTCQRCIDACPTGALSSSGLDWRKCISYLTQSKVLSKEDEALLLRKNPENYLYGCDLCQLVCPYNHKPHDTETAEFELAYPKLASILAMSRKELQGYFGATAAGWRLACIKRNAELCLKNK